METNQAKDMALVDTKTCVDPRGFLATAHDLAHWREDLTDEQYHADTTAVGSTNLRLCLDSPKAFYSRVILQTPQRESDALRLGKLIHSAFLEPDKFNQQYVLCPDFGDMRSSINRGRRMEWMNRVPPGAQVIMSQIEFDRIRSIVEAVLSHSDSAFLMSNGKCEMPGFYRDPETGIRLKIKPDFLSNDGVRLNDLKSTRDSSWMKFGSDSFSKRYDIQMYMQAIGVKSITGKFPDVISLIAVEKDPPYECAIYYFQEADLEQAKTDYHRALARLKSCIDQNHWPARQERIERIYTPNYFINNAVRGEI